MKNKNSLEKFIFSPAYFSKFIFLIKGKFRKGGEKMELPGRYGVSAPSPEAVLKSLVRKNNRARTRGDWDYLQYTQIRCSSCKVFIGLTAGECIVCCMACGTVSWAGYGETKIIG